jgi:MFS family permease
VILYAVMNLNVESRKKLIFFSFLLIDFFTAVDIGATTIATPKIVDYFAVGKNLVTWIVNADIVALSFSLVILLFLSERIKRRNREKYFLIEGLIYFIIGSALCFFSKNSALFFFGQAIKGFGKGMIFVGQLWVITKSFGEKIVTPLVWTEVGLAVGIVSGPIIGGILTGIYFGSWKLIFLLDLCMGIMTMLFFGLNYKQERQGRSLIHINKKEKLNRTFWAIIICEFAIAAVALGLEFVISVYFQNYRSFSPMSVGLLLLCSSVGIISGSNWAAKREGDYLKLIQKGMIYLTIVLILIGSVLFFKNDFALVILLFGEGFLFGFLGVINYAYISKIISENLIVKGAILYLLFMQIGNAVGVQLESFWEFTKGNFLLYIVVLVILVQISLLTLFQNRSSEISDIKKPHM